jgi:hypothetical protein
VTRLFLLATVWSLAAAGQPALEFESGGLRYQALTRAGVTVMVAPLPTRVLGHAILQVAITNGSSEARPIRPDKFLFQSTSADRPAPALTARAVVNEVLHHASRGDVGRLVGVYEAALFGTPNLELRHGYEARRKDAMAIGGTRMRAAAAAAAIVLGESKLGPGQATDGAVFLPSSAKAQNGGILTFQIAEEQFEFRLAPVTSK